MLRRRRKNTVAVPRWRAVQHSAPDLARRLLAPVRPGSSQKMLQRVIGRSGWFLEVGLALATAAAGCGGEDGPSPVARNRVVGRPVEVQRTMRSEEHTS